MNKWHSYIIIISLSFFSCGTLKKTFKISLFPDSMQKDAIIDSLNSKKAHYAYLNLKAKIKTNSEQVPIKSLGINVRMKKDSLIWVSISAKGIAGLRISIKPDSVILLDKINKRYWQYPFDSIQKFISFPVSFKNIEDLIIGDPFFISKTNFKEFKKSEILQLKFDYPRFNNEVFVDPKTYDLRMMNTEDKILNQMLKITQSDFQSISGKSFAHTRNIQIIRNDTLYFDLVVKKIKLNEKLSFPFRISNKYEKAN